MNTSLKMDSDVNSDVSAVDVDLVITQDNRSIKDIIDEYKAITIKLSLLADNVPGTEEENVEDLIKKEIFLLDRRAALLETALSRPVTSHDGAVEILALWHLEVIQSQTADSLSAADELVKSVYDYLKIN